MIDATLISSSGKQLTAQGLDETQAISANDMQATDNNEEIFSELFESQLTGDLEQEFTALIDEELSDQPAWQIQNPLLPDGNGLPPELLNVATLGKDPAMLTKTHISGELNDQAIKNHFNSETEFEPVDLKDLSKMHKPDIGQKIITERQTPAEIIPVLQKDLQQGQVGKSIEDLSLSKSNETLLSKIVETNSNPLKSDVQPIQMDKAPLLNLLQPNSIVNKPITNTVPANLSVNVPMNEAAWGEALAGKISWMIMENHQSAKINLNPAELGPIEVKVRMSNDQAAISFVAQHAEARDALEQAFPKLRDMLSQSGINLGESNVSGQSEENASDADSAEGFASDDYYNSNESTLDPTEGGMTPITQLINGFVDHYV